MGRDGRPLRFTGVRVAGRLVVAGADDEEELQHLCDRLAGIDPEAAIALRRAVAAPAAAPDDERRGDERRGDERLLDELSQLNNELATLQRQLVKQKVELERLNEEKNHLLGMAAHDLRNPLQVISLYGRLLLGRPQGAWRRRRA